MNNRLFFLLNMARNKVFKRVDATSEKELGIPVTQVAALLFISKCDGCSQNELAEALGLNKPGASGLVKRMEKGGLIVKKPSSDDARVTKLSLSETGLALTPRIPPYIQQMNKELTKGFTDDELEVVGRFLHSTINRFK